VVVALTRAKEYRRRAQASLDIARETPLGEMRTVLIDAAQTWLRWAEEEEASIPPGAVKEPQAPMQQQQQVQPGKKG
jgi:hypothetical protein